MSSASDAIPLADAGHHAGLPANGAETVELTPITRQRQATVLLSSFLVIFVTIGFNQSYGVFQSYYISPTQTMLSGPPGNEGALIALVGTLGAGLTWAGSVFVNPLMARLDKKGNRYLGVAGVLFMSLGFGLASLSTKVR